MSKKSYTTLLIFLALCSCEGDKTGNNGTAARDPVPNRNVIPNRNFNYYNDPYTNSTRSAEHLAQMQADLRQQQYELEEIERRMQQRAKEAMEEEEKEAEERRRKAIEAEKARQKEREKAERKAKKEEEQRRALEKEEIERKKQRDQEEAERKAQEEVERLEKEKQAQAKKDAEQRAKDVQELIEACSQGRHLYVGELLKKGIDPNTRDGNGNTLLHRAAKNGHLEVVQLLLSNGANVDPENTEGETPLSLACNTKNEDLIKFLIDQGANVFANDSAPIKRICLHGLEEIIKYLIKKKFSGEEDKENRAKVMNVGLNPASCDANVLNYLIDLQNPDFTEETLNEALVKACARSMFSEKKSLMKEFIQKLVGKFSDKINVNYADDSQRNSLFYAVDAQAEGIVDFLLKHGATVNLKILNKSCSRGNVNIFNALYAKLENPGFWESIDDKGLNNLLFASVNKDFSIFSKILEHATNVNTVNNNVPLLFRAIDSGNQQKLEALIRKGAKINDRYNDDKTALIYAVEKGKLEAVILLLKNGATINKQNKIWVNTLVAAIREKKFELAKTIIDSGIPVNEKDTSGLCPLHYAAKYDGHLNIVKHLIEHGADINAKDNGGFTALHLASEKGSLNIVTYLVEHKADINAKDNLERTALHYASQNGHINIVRYLVEHKADINAKDNGGFTALHLASEKGSLDIVKHLVEHGTDINAKNWDGHTVLHRASENGYLDIVRYLVEHKADINAEDNLGCTALDCACNHTEVATFLKEHGATSDERK